jgi:hypothetical protein
MQKELTEPHALHDENGHLIEPGKAKKLIQTYERSKVKAGKLRIKEWDYYEILNEHYGITLLYHDVGYLGVALVAWTDFDKGTHEEFQSQNWFCRGKMNLPPGDQGDIVYDRDGDHWECLRRGEDRIFKFNFPKFRNGAGISGEITLTQPAEMDGMVNVIPFPKKTQFVYALKLHNMIPDGKVKVGEEEYEFTDENGSNGVLDWTRAVFPYHVEWRWSAFNGKVNGKPFGLLVDYGHINFGIESNKDMVFVNFKGQYLDKIHYTWDKKDPHKDWHFKSVNDDRVNGIMKVKWVHTGGMNFVVLKTQVLKAYGFFIGTVKLDDGTLIEIKEEDRVFGHAEAVVNYW